MVLLLVKAVGPLVLQRQFMEEGRVILSQMGKYLLILALRSSFRHTKSPRRLPFLTIRRCNTRSLAGNCLF